MLAAELATDFGKRGGGQLLDDVHGHLARESDGASVAANFQILFTQIEMLADPFLNQVNRDALFLRRDDVAQDLLRGGKRDGHARQGGVSHQTGKCSFKFAHIGLNSPRDVFSNVIGKRKAIVVGLFLKNRNFSFQIRWLDVRDQTPLETRAQSFFNGVDVFGQAVARNDNLLLLFIKSVERVEELFLGAFFSSDELDVIDQQDIDGVETVAETDHAIEADGVDDFDGEFFRADVTEAHRRIALLDGVPDSVHQVGLAHAHTAIEEQRVVSLGRLLSTAPWCAE